MGAREVAMVSLCSREFNHLIRRTNKKVGSPVDGSVPVPAPIILWACPYLDTTTVWHYCTGVGTQLCD
jgi:hypothetical protein